MQFLELFLRQPVHFMFRASAALICFLSFLFSFYLFNSVQFQPEMKSWMASALDMVHNSHRPDEDHDWAGPDAREKLFEKFRKRYSLLKPELLSHSLRKLYLPLRPDDETIQYLLKNPPTSYWTSWKFYFLCKVWTRTDVLGYLGIGKMHVLSTGQIRSLLSPHLTSFDALLDLGAGSGDVTDYFVPLFNKITTTEVSQSMVDSLKAKGFESLAIGDVNDPSLDGRKFDCISLLNLLDRCDKPLSLLNDLKSKLKPNGVLLIALVFPFSPWVETSSGYVRPKEKMEIKSEFFEDTARKFVETVLVPNGFVVKALSKIPYLSQGDYYRELYALTDSLWVVGLNPKMC